MAGRGHKTDENRPQLFGHSWKHSQAKAVKPAFLKPWLLWYGLREPPASLSEPPLAPIWCPLVSSPLKSLEQHISKNSTQQTPMKGYCGPELRQSGKGLARPVSSSHVLEWDGGTRRAHTLPSDQAEGRQGHRSSCQSTEEGAPPSVPRRHKERCLGTRSCLLGLSLLCLSLAVQDTQVSGSLCQKQR